MHTRERDRDRDRDRRDSDRDRDRDRHKYSDDRERERDQRDVDRIRREHERESDTRSKDHRHTRDSRDSRDSRSDRRHREDNRQPSGPSQPSALQYRPTHAPVVTTPSTIAPSMLQAPNTTVRPELDFFSEKFDPLQALYKLTELPPTLPKVRPLTAFHKCRHLLPPSDPDYLAPPSKKTKEAEQKAKWEELSESEKRIKGMKREDMREEKRTREEKEGKGELPIFFATEIDEQRAIIVSAQMQRKKEKMKIELNKSVLDEITVKLDVGPLSMLKKCMEEKCRIRVVIRRVRDIRGYCVGQLQAFDKHFNMILRNVFEEYSVWEYDIPRQINRGTNNNSNNDNNNANNRDGNRNDIVTEDTDMQTEHHGDAARPERRLVKRTRRRKQLLIKGDTIVLVHRWVQS